MVDREKVIRGLECCMSGQLDGLGCSRVPCPYNLFEDCEGILHRDALALLKEKGQIKPSKVIGIQEVDEGFSGNCARCGALLDKFYNAEWCGSCGERVKWE